MQSDGLLLPFKDKFEGRTDEVAGRLVLVLHLPDLHQFRVVVSRETREVLCLCVNVVLLFKPLLNFMLGQDG